MSGAGSENEGVGSATVVDMPSPSAPSNRDAQRAVVDMHRHIARRLLAQGNKARAFTELVRATRESPMSVPLASALMHFGLASGSVNAAATLLTQGLEEVEAVDRLDVMRCLARLLRRSNDAERCGEVLVMLLAERPADRRARAVFNALLEAAGRWEELDASLEKEAKVCVKAGQLKRASRAALARGRIWAERHQDHARAALRYGQAAQWAEEAGDWESGFLLRMVWLRALHRGGAQPLALREATVVARKTAATVGRGDRVTALLNELGLTSDSTFVMEEGAPTDSGESTGPRRRSTQLELIAVAEAVQQKNRAPEVAAVLAAAHSEGPDVAAVEKLEAHYRATNAWRPLVELYADAAQASVTPADRGRWIEKRAKVFEAELRDVARAAEAWGQVANLTNSPKAAQERDRLQALAARAQRRETGLELPFEVGGDTEARVRALVLRGEERLAKKELAAAAMDFEAALALSPQSADACAGLAELGAMRDDLRPVERLVQALSSLAPGAYGRGELYRRLARLADSPLDDAALGTLAWTEVLAEEPFDEEALGRSLALAREAGDDERLEVLLRSVIKVAPKGQRAKAARMQLAGVLDALGRDGESIELLRQATKADPAHADAWQAYGERLLRAGKTTEALEALERAAEGASTSALKAQRCRRLSRLFVDLLEDDERGEALLSQARTHELKARADENLVTQALPSVRLERPSPKAKPKPRDDFERVASALGARREFDTPMLPRAPRLPTRFAAAEAATPPPIELPDEPETFAERDDDEVLEVDSGDVIEVAARDLDMPRAALEPPLPSAPGPRRTPRPMTAIEALPFDVPPRPAPYNPAQQIAAERESLFAHVRERPLEADSYKMLAEHFDAASDPGRSSLMLEIARALEGDPNAAPKSPRLILSANDRAGLKHALLRSEAGELLGLMAPALTKLFPHPSKAPPKADELHVDAGKGAKGVADALLAAVRILGLRAPDVFVTDEAGPPFALSLVDEPKLFVTKAVVKKEASDAELRFYAGRALFTLTPELLVLRTLKKEQLHKGLLTVAQACAGTLGWQESKLVRESVTARAFERLKPLAMKLQGKLDFAQLSEGARHSANRAGLVVCGGVAPVIAALRAKRALPIEMVELVRFAASERYLALRERALRSRPTR